MAISLIIVTFRTGRPLRDCVSSALAADEVEEIVVVDNGNAGAETRYLDELARHPRIRVLRGHGNVGFARACNLGAGAARGDVLVFVNPDALLAAGAPAHLARVLLALEQPALVGGDLRDLQGRPERGSRRERLTSWRAFVSVTGLSRLERYWPLLRDFNRHCDPLPDAPVRVGCISGALFALRKLDYESLGGLDDGYFLHVEDVDICRRAELRGWPVLFVPGPHGVHVRSSSDVRSKELALHKARGFARYFRKFGGNSIERGLAHLVGVALGAKQ